MGVHWGAAGEGGGGQQWGGGATTWWGEGVIARGFNSGGVFNL